MKKPMTIRQRLLALDAAVVAAENIPSGVPVSDNLRAAIALLQDELDAHFQTTDMAENFDQFLEEQYAAVQTLATSPEVFGSDVVY
jgi:hypothetical protein